MDPKVLACNIISNIRFYALPFRDKQKNYWLKINPCPDKNIKKLISLEISYELDLYTSWKEDELFVDLISKPE